MCNDIKDGFVIRLLNSCFLWIVIIYMLQFISYDQV